MVSNEKSVLRGEFKGLAEDFFAAHSGAALENMHAEIAAKLARYTENFFSAGKNPPERVGIYKPLQYELPVRQIVEQVPLLTQGTFLYPEYDKDSMWFVDENSGEKATPDFMIVPGLFVDKSGNRLGRGKGYYDHYLRDVPLALERRVFLGYPFQFLEFVPALARDVRVFTLPPT
ncbi:MAG: hypothetical protein KF713_12640 [Turneriella sp.]|nr:hypothetical protein [Turneriella sp.]